ncbi:MAG: EAL domain-containing protein [Mailhella sp.]|nr:EAL domain-containing protein [Mailhella sp.]
MPPALSRTTQYIRAIVIAVILALQVASLWVAFHLNTAIVQRTDTYATEAAQLASSVINSRITAVRQILSKMAGDLIQKTDQRMPDEELAHLIQAYKGLWNYSDMRLLKYEGGIAQEDFSSIPGKERKLIERAAKEKRITMGQSSMEKCIAYAVPVLNGKELAGVLLVVRGSEQAEQLLNIDVFSHAGVTLLVDYQHDILVKNWSTDLPHPHDHANFIGKGKALVASAFGPDYRIDKNGLWRFKDQHGHEWLAAQNTNEEYGLSLLYAAPVNLLMGGLPSLRWQNLLMHLATFTGTILLLVDIYLLHRFYRRKILDIELTDRLTGGDNTRNFQNKLSRILAESKDGCALVSMDINKFKLINEEYGVDKANELLRLIYSIITANLGPGELCAHHTADTFLMLLRHSDEAGMQERLARLMDEIMKRKHELGLTHQQGLSAGVYVIDDRMLPDYIMLDHANLAREICKQPPYPSIQFYDESVQEQRRRDADILNSFGQSLENGDFEVWLQPKVNIRTNMVSGAEALVRWNHPELGFLAPGAFLPVLESNGRVGQLDLWVFRQVCRILSRWDREGREIVPIAVNLSRTQLTKEDFLTDYLNILNEYDVDPHWIELELTENIFVENEEAISQLFSTIRSHGLRCAIDDFGTGYSSLSLLRRAKIDTVKLDRSFFTEDELSAQSKAVIRSITQLSSALGLVCVAEGVENQATLEFLLSTDCSIAQGYFYSRPLKVEAFESYAYSEEKTCKILSTGFVCYLSDAPRQASSLSSSVDKELLSLLPGVGLCVVKKQNHELLFFNDVMKEMTPHIAEGMLCHELWTSHCSSCPLMMASRDKASASTTRSDVFGCSVRLTAREVLWDSSIPAFIVTLIPLSRDDDDDDDGTLNEDIKRWKKQAQEDSLTSFLNRNQFNVEVKAAFSTHEKGTLFIIDLDGFKQVNDTFGHLMGDEVLRNTAKRIRLSFRKDDILCRYGGDEFIVYTPKLTSREIIEQRMQTLQGLLRHPHTLDGVFSAVTASIGIASFPADGADLTELFANADTALYEAKHRGKDQYVFFDELTYSS